MKYVWEIALVSILVAAPEVRAEDWAVRPDLSAAKPLAACKLQTLAVRPDATAMRPPSPFVLEALPEDPLNNYERTELGNWHMPAEGELSDPWIRLLLVAPKRPIVIDLAVFIDGKPFRGARDAWMNDLLPSKLDAVAAGNNSSENGGTEAEGGASKGEATEAGGSEDASRAAGEKEGSDTIVENADGKVNAEEEKAAPAVPTVAAKSRGLVTMRDRLANYMAASGGEVNREEIRWLVAEWGAGPSVVVLDPSLAWQRAGVATLKAVLDTDADGGLSAAEISQAGSALNKADFDGNGVVDVNEMRRASRGEAAMPYAIGHSMLVILDENTDWDALGGTLAAAYGKGVQNKSAAEGAASIIDRIARGDSSVGADELRSLSTMQADVSLRANFGVTDSSQAGVNVVGLGEALASDKDAAGSTESVATVQIGADYLEISAADGRTTSDTAVNESQVAVGAVLDGNPLLRLVDADQDGRLTQRERQELGGLLASLDRDGDGNVSAGETPLPIRFGVTIGPHVHELLAKATGAGRAVTPTASPAPPEWFASMDKNNDKDLSREEFLGTPEQFKKFDGDGDGLLNVTEALKLDAGQ